MVTPRVLTGTLGGAVMVAGWVVLGALGPRHAPLWAGGLLPLALGLGVAGGTVHAVRSRWFAARGGRAIARLAAAGTLASLAGVVGGPGGPVALGLAAVCWGVWVGALADRAAPGSGGGDHLGGLACALPSSRAGEWRTASAWGPLAARWSMVPMMATLGLMGGWCGAPGGGWGADAIALHLLAMGLPAVALTSLRLRLDGAWAAAAMAAAGLALCCVPGLRGLMIASGLQAVGWGLAAALRPAAGTPRPAVGGSGFSSVCPALLVLGLGFAIDHSGPAALGAVQAALSVVGAAGLVARALDLARTASRRRRWTFARSG